MNAVEEIKIGTVAVTPLPTPDIQVFRAEVTPEMAREWLADQLPNRRIKEANVARWARDMKRGVWLEPVQPIQFNPEGRLLDGQNRLSAVIEAGITVTLWVAVGVDTEFRRAIDLGTSRTASDVLHLTKPDLLNRHRLASIARAVLQYQTHPDRVWGTGKTTPSISEVVSEIEADLDLYMEAAAVFTSARVGARSGQWFTPGAHGVLYVMASRGSEYLDLWETYSEGLITGAGLEKGDPRLTLRESPIPGVVSGGTWRAQASVLAAVKAWNAWVRNEKLGKIFASSPKYLPMPKVL